MKRALGVTRTANLLLGLGCSSLLSAGLLGGCGESTGNGAAGGGGMSATTTTTTSSGGGGPIAECASASDCPDPGNECVLRLCLGHQCGTLDAAYGTPTIAQTDGDCKRSICDGKGNATSVDDDADTADDGKQCTVDVCKNGALAHDPAPAGTPCAEGGGTRCNASGACVQCNADADCAAGAVCSTGSCVAPACTDQVLNGTETDVDCGGAACAGCDDGKACAVHADCKSGLCAAGKCAATTPIITAISANGHDRFFNVKLDAQGNIFAVGVAAPGTDATTDYATIVAKFTPQGVLDKTFATDGVFTKNLVAGANGELARAIGLQSNGKIIVGATVEQIGAADARDRDVAIFRLDANGTLDTTFGTGGVAILNLADGVVNGTGFSTDSIWHLVVQPDDKIVFTGSQVRPGNTDTDFAMVRLTADGALDPTFGTNGKVLVDVGNAGASARSLTLLPNGSLLGAGYADIGGVGTPVVYKVTSAGVLDTTFGAGGVYNAVVLAAQTEAYSIVPQGNKLVTAGYGRANATTESLDWLSLRFLPNGTLDPTYGTNGVARLDVAGFNDNARSVLVLPDGRVVLAGSGRPSSSNVDGAVGVLTANGQPDTAFSAGGVRLYDLGGANDFLWGLELAPSQDYLVLAGIKGIATGGTGNDDTALLLVPLK